MDNRFIAELVVILRAACHQVIGRACAVQPAGQAESQLSEWNVFMAILLNLPKHQESSPSASHRRVAPDSTQQVTLNGSKFVSGPVLALSFSFIYTYKNKEGSAH